jgi:hypothetical protein
MKTNWIHVDIWFKEKTPHYKKQNYYSPRILTTSEKNELDSFIAMLLKKLKWLYKRKFFLHEPNPHVFIALELRSKLFKPLVNSILYKLKHPSFIERMYLNDWCGDDQGNGDGFLDILSAMTDFHLYRRDNKLSHIIHCCIEFQVKNKEEEINFYKTMVDKYE